MSVPIWFEPAPRPSCTPAPPVAGPRPLLPLTIDGRETSVPAGATILDACQSLGIDTPTLCFAETLTPVNACRICVVELAGSRTLVPACSRKVEPGMAIQTDSDRVRTSRRLVLELLGSSVDLSQAAALAPLMERYGADPTRFGKKSEPAAADERDARKAGHHHAPDGTSAETVAQPIKVDNDLYVRDYARCVLCYKCVEACGTDAQHTFAIAVAGRGFDARISTEWALPLPESACVYCGNCIAVCPTGALQGKTEHDLRQAGAWDPARQTTADTVCPYCGVGCVLTLHVQNDRLVKVSSPPESSVTSGNLCIKGRFGTVFVRPTP